MKASIIIRTKNEAKRIEDVLKTLVNQSEKDFEVIVVDSGSTDKTLSFVKKYQKRISIKIFEIPSVNFTYPYACNYGVRRSSGEYLIFLSGHSVPINSDWLKHGLENFRDKNVAGVYGNVKSSIDASLTEKVYYFIANLISAKREIIREKRLGVLGNTNSIIRRDLWIRRKFNEKFILGGEDSEWANYFLNRGHSIIRDSRFSVYHSHGFGLFRFLKQHQVWLKTYNSIN